MSIEPNWKNDNVLDHDASNNKIYTHASLSQSFFDIELLTNQSMHDCEKQYERLTKQFFELYKEGFCEVTFDGLSCWPPTPPNQTATIKCFSELNQVKYDDTSKLFNSKMPLLILNLYNCYYMAKYNF